MEICFLKSNALETLKTGLPQTFEKYFVEKDNSWLTEICGENPFEKFRNVPDFELAPLDKGLEPGEIDFRNCKILYKNLHFLTPRQAADERFWAGLCHGVFYNYLRRRCEYDCKEIYPKATDEIKTRFFFEANSRTGIFRNVLSKCWWTGRTFYDSTLGNSFEKLDVIGSNDLSSKISYILRYPFTANPKILNGIIKFFRHFNNGKSLGTLKNTLRPAIYELNKRGGAVVLDCLTEEEIAAIMIEYVEKFFAVKKSVESVKLSSSIPRNPIATEKPEVKSANDNTSKINRDSAQTVKHNSTIKVVPLDGDRHRMYKIGDELKKNHLNIYNELLGKKLNSVVTIKGKRFKITEIKQARSLKNF